MKKRHTTIITAILFLGFLSSCNSLSSYNLTDNASVEALSLEIEKEIEGLENLDIMKIRFSGEELEQKVLVVSLTYKKEEEDYFTINYYPGSNGRQVESDAIFSSLDKIESIKPLAYKSIHLSNITNNIDEAVEMVITDDPSMEFKAVAIYELFATSTENEIEETFTLNFIEKGAESYTEGGEIITDYYYYDFVVVDGIVLNKE